MKCALVMPSWLPEDVFPEKTARAQANYWQPLNLLYMGACLERGGHEVIFLDGSFLGHETIINRIKDFKPGLVGVYSNAFLWSRAKKTASDIKAIHKGIHLTCGGPYPIATREKCIEESDFDSIVTCEGEHVIVEMVERLEGGRTLEEVKGTIYREDNIIIVNSQADAIEDLDSLPMPARHLLLDPMLYLPPPGNYKRKPVAIIMTSRGCDMHCIYCFQPGERRIRYRGVENVLQEIEAVVKDGYKEVRFLDDTFCGDYDRAMEIAREIKNRGLDISWYVSARVNQVDEPLLRAFKEAGCWAILFGAESGVQKNLNALKKGITLKQTRKAVKAAKEAGLVTCLPFIFGIPGETYAEGLETIDFAIELDPDIANFHTLTPFPGTELYENIDKYGTINGDLENFTYEGTAFVPHTMKKEEIEELRSIAFRKFYSRPKFLLKKLLKMRSLEDLKVIKRGVKSLFWILFKGDLFKARRG
ncbi:B12-binding domain-containing radical SAM protein [archaeon]|nr:B12-binding domain-containing radical SAM protein [archaeon]